LQNIANSFACSMKDKRLSAAVFAFFVRDIIDQSVKKSKKGTYDRETNCIYINDLTKLTEKIMFLK